MEDFLSGCCTWRFSSIELVFPFLGNQTGTGILKLKFHFLRVKYTNKDKDDNEKFVSVESIQFCGWTGGV